MRMSDRNGSSNSHSLVIDPGVLSFVVKTASRKVFNMSNILYNFIWTIHMSADMSISQSVPCKGLQKL